MSGIRSGWRCTVCKRPSASKAKLLAQKCEGQAMKKCQKLAEREERRNSMMDTAVFMLGWWSGAQPAGPMPTRRRTAWGRSAKVPRLGNDPMEACGGSSKS